MRPKQVAPQCSTDFERALCRLRARASLRTRRQGPSSMGFEDEVEQSFGRPCRQTNGRFKRTYELTSSIVPRGTSFHRAVELALAARSTGPTVEVPEARMTSGASATSSAACLRI